MDYLSVVYFAEDSVRNLQHEFWDVLSTVLADLAQDVYNIPFRWEVDA